MSGNRPLPTEDVRPFWLPHYATRVQPHPPPLVDAFAAPLVGCCINAEWMTHILGTTAILEWGDMWEGTPNQIQFALDQIVRIQDAMTCQCSCGGLSITRNTITSSFRFQLQLEFIANGINGVAPDRPDIYFDLDTADAGDDITRRENALCMACEDYVITIYEGILNTARDIGLEIAGVVGPLAFAVGPIAGLFAVIGVAALTHDLLLLLNNDNYREDITCCMRDGLAGIAITEANFQASLSGCGFTVPSLKDTMRELVEESLNDTGNYLSFVKSLGAYFSYAGIGLTECNCDFWEHVFDFRTGELGWTAYNAGDGFGPRALHVTGTGWGNHVHVNIDHLIQIEIAFPSRRILEVEVNAVHTHPPDITYQCKMPDVGGADFTQGQVKADSAPVLFLVDVTSTGLWISVSDEDPPRTNFQGHIRTITVRGTGIDPF